LGEIRNAVVEESEGNMPVRRPKRRCKDNIKMDLNEIGYEGMDWIHLEQDTD
jgi:hypothetical protein